MVWRCMSPLRRLQIRSIGIPTCLVSPYGVLGLWLKKAVRTLCSVDRKVLFV